MTALLFLALTAARADELPAGWVKFDSGELAFTAAMPGEVKQRKAVEKDLNGNPVEVVFHFAANEGVTYVVGVSKFDDPEYLKQSKKVVYDNSREGSLKRSKGKLVKEGDVKLEKIEGRDFTVSIAQGGSFVRSRLFVGNGRLYSTLIAARSEAETDSKDAKRFLDSFKILDPAKAKKKEEPKGGRRQKGLTASFKDSESGGETHSWPPFR